MASAEPSLPGTDVNKVQALYPGTVQSVAYTGTHGVITNAVKASVVRVHCTSNAYIKMGTAPTATSSDMRVVADQPEYFRIVPGEKVSAIQVSAGGTLYVTEMD